MSVGSILFITTALQLERREQGGKVACWEALRSNREQIVRTREGVYEPRGGTSYKFLSLLTTIPVRCIVCIRYCIVHSIKVVLTVVLDTLRFELRRGCLILAVLAQLRSEHYGYALRKALADQGMDIDENTLYPLLRRLESQGLLSSAWREENKRNKRFYRLAPDGEVVLSQLVVEWKAIDTSLNRILSQGLLSDEEQ